MLLMFSSYIVKPTSLLSVQVTSEMNVRSTNVSTGHVDPNIPSQIPEPICVHDWIYIRLAEEKGVLINNNLVIKCTCFNVLLWCWP